MTPIERAAAALRPFAELGEVWTKGDPTDESPWTKMADETRLTVGAAHMGWNHVTVGHLREATAVLAMIEKMQVEGR